MFLIFWKLMVFFIISVGVDNVSEDEERKARTDFINIIYVYLQINNHLSSGRR